MPIERAVPSTMRSAASTLVALRSFILVWAISRNCALVICPTFALLGVEEPLSTPAAFFSRSEAGRRLGDEGERAIFVDGDLDRHDAAGLVGGALVVFLAEAHDVDAVLAERRTNRLRGRRLAGLNLQLDDGANFLCHKSSPSRSLGWTDVLSPAQSPPSHDEGRQPAARGAASH